MLLLQNVLGALEQLWAKKARSLLTVLGIIIAVTSTIVVVSLVRGFANHVTRFVEGLGTNLIMVFPIYPGGNNPTAGKGEMVRADIEEVQRHCPALSLVAPVVLMRSLKVRYSKREVSLSLPNARGTTDDFQHIRNWYVDVGRCFGPVDLENRRQVCVLGRDLLRDLDADQSIVGDYVIVNGKRFQVIGLLERKPEIFGESMDGIILIPYTTALDMFPEYTRYMAFYTRAESPDQVGEAKAQIINVLRRRHRLGPDQANDFEILTQDQIREETDKITGAATLVLTGIVGISLIVGGIGIMNVMLVSVTERTREIGLRKAVGARRRDILAQFLTEAVVLSVLGGVIGIGLGYALTYIASLHPKMVDISVPLWVVILGVGFSGVVGVVFGILPAIKAAILHPIDALRYE